MFIYSGPALAKYPQNYLSAKLGANVTTEAKLTGPFEPNALLSDGPISKARFADGNIQIDAAILLI